ncbi:hypothetical protein [Enterovirga rhinocerotis]|uniref:COG3904 family protein n=1 Tax=Enterovirga rhinocerotis TaxID=1339210 RepID=UPI0010612B56|nr:hypothetical protein [Enterovirga rhinocerotis]
MSVLLASCAAGAAEFETKALSSPPRAVIFATGQIVQGDHKRFQAALRDAKRIKSNMHPLLVLESPGGVAAEAFAIGRSVKRNSIATAILSGSYCASACSVIFFGGYDAKAKALDRSVYGAVRLGVHRWGPPKIIGWNPKRPVPASILAAAEKRTRQDFQSYYDDMRVSPEIRRRTFETPFASIYLLSRAEMTDSGIGARLAAQTPHDGLMPLELRCRGACPVPKLDLRPSVVTTSAGGSQDAPTKPIAGMAYLRGWANLINKRVTIEDCTLWQPASARAPCLVRENGVRRGFVIVAASDPERPGWAIIRDRCTTGEPVEACRVELTGTLLLTSRGPVFAEATARFLDTQGETASTPDARLAVSAPGVTTERDPSAVELAADVNVWR